MTARFAPRAFTQRWRAFARATRAGATTIAAVAVTVMTVGGAALVIDHTWLVDQRDVLQLAAEAGVIAATQEIDRQLAEDPSISDEDLKAALETVARQYVFMNLFYLPIERLLLARDSLKVKITGFDRAKRAMRVHAEADLGGTLLSRALPLLGNNKGPKKTVVSAGVETESIPVEVVLAIDISGSMAANFEGSEIDYGRLNAVKAASKKLVAALDPNEDDQVAVGIVPWNDVVQLDTTAAEKWALNDWAKYPARRTYPFPYIPDACDGGLNPDCTPPAAVVQTLPARPTAWLGCLDGHRIDGGTSIVPKPTTTALFEAPSATPFAQSYFQPIFGYSYRCLSDSERPGGRTKNKCGHLTGGGIFGQYACKNQPKLMPLSTVRSAIDSAIDDIDIGGTGLTFSTLGVLWAQRMLEPAWKGVWGGSVHPADPQKTEYTDIRKAIVLLTDGEDGYCGYGRLSCSDSPMAVSRTEACAAAKDQGTEIFVVTAMAPRHVSAPFAKTLEKCSSEAADEKYYPEGTRRPGVTYIYTSNANSEDLEAVFAQIGQQLRTIRKTF